NMQITVEFTTLARFMAGEARIHLTLPVETTYGEIVTCLAELYPAMVGIIIAEDKKSLLNSNLFIINGEMSQPAFIMNESPRDGDRLTIVSVATGG
ncbi:MAG: MoaD/ThiS family protein, partial [Peptococcaceae bacterium]|nr:MoaD/ThiS family protein [Peptococcaceae bacterium]